MVKISSTNSFYNVSVIDCGSNVIFWTGGPVTCILNLVQGSIPGTTKYISEPEELLYGLAQFQGLNGIYQNILVAIAALKTFFSNNRLY